MILKFFKRGAGNTKSGESVENYLLDDERQEKEQALVLRVQGYSYTEIAKTLNIGRRTAINWCNQVVQVQA